MAFAIGQTAFSSDIAGITRLGSAQALESIRNRVL
jgi:hypothetical protein